MQILYIIIGVLVVWVLVLTVLVILMRNFFKSLGKDVKSENLIKLLQNLSDIEKQNSTNIQQLKNLISEIEKADKFHIQRTGLVKYNPFEEVGGEHSFSLCLLDDNETGYLITGLHTRDRTRVYLKEIIKGKNKVELSKEESKALKIAQKN